MRFRSLRALAAAIVLVVPVVAATTQTASATQGFVFAGACTVNVQANFSPGLVQATGVGTCVVDDTIVSGGFTTTAFTTGPTSCAAAVGTGGGSFDLGAPVGVGDSPTTEQVAFAAGTASIVFEYNTFQLTAVATLAVVPGDAPGCFLGSPVAHYTGTIVLQDPVPPTSPSPRPRNSEATQPPGEGFGMTGPAAIARPPPM